MTRPTEHIATQRRNQMLALYRDGKTPAEIGEEMGVTAKHVRHILNREALAFMRQIRANKARDERARQHKKTALGKKDGPAVPPEIDRRDAELGSAALVRAIHQYLAKYQPGTLVKLRREFGL